MSGRAIILKQVKLYMKQRSKGGARQQASAKVGISESSGERIEKCIIPGKNGSRHWGIRKDPFVSVCECAIIPLLEKQPCLMPITLFEDLGSPSRPFSQQTQADFPAPGENMKGVAWTEQRGHVPPT